jgi:hypothetical protein
MTIYFRNTAVINDFSPNSINHRILLPISSSQQMFILAIMLPAVPIHQLAVLVANHNFLRQPAFHLLAQNLVFNISRSRPIVRLPRNPVARQ